MANKFNCAPKFDQKVRIPTREQVRKVFDEFANPVKNQIFPIKEFIKLLADFIAERYSVNVMHATAVEVDLGDININAYYDFEDDEFCKIAIELVLVTNTQEKFLLFSEELYSDFVKRLADALAHELVHMKQARARDHIYVEFKLKNTDVLDRELLYLSSPDEIDAYSYNIAVELEDSKTPLRKLANPSTITMEDSLNLWVYVTTFKNNFKNPALRKLLKKVYKKLS